MSRRGKSKDPEDPPYVARSATDLLAIAPQVLRFEPEDSVVLLTFGPVGEAFHARVDLPVEREAQEEVADLLLGALLRNHLELAAVLVYSTDADATRSQAQILVERLVAAGVGVVDVLRVEKDRYFHPLDAYESEVGTPYDLAVHPFTARRVFEGHVVHGSRDAVADTLVGSDEAEIAAVRAAADAEGDRLVDGSLRGLITGSRADALWMQGRIRRFRRTGRPLPTADAGRILFLCRCLELRDVAWAEMSRADAARDVELWTDLVRRSPAELLPAPAALLGFAAWLSGDGALAWCALDRCTAVAPDYRMAELVGEMLLRAVPPSTWAGISADALEVFSATRGVTEVSLDPFVQRPVRRAG